MRKRKPELTENLVVEPAPASFDIVPQRGEDTEAIALAVQGRSSPPSNRCATARRSPSGSCRSRARSRSSFSSPCIVLLAASTILIANTIRLSIFARRREIEVMKLVGATNWFVRGPFMLEGVLTGLAGSLAAVILLFLGARARGPADSSAHPGRPGRARARVHVDGADLVGAGSRSVRSGRGSRSAASCGSESGEPSLGFRRWRRTRTRARAHTRREPGRTPTRRCHAQTRPTVSARRTSSCWRRRHSCSAATTSICSILERAHHAYLERGSRCAPFGARSGSG